MTIWVTITDATPQAIQDLLDDPRTDSDTGYPAETTQASSTPGSIPDFGTPAQHPMVVDGPPTTFGPQRPAPAQTPTWSMSHRPRSLVVDVTSATFRGAV
jgi:hypothetical protein